MRIDGDKLIFSTGREFYTYGGFVGLGPALEISAGYDDLFDPIGVSRRCMTAAEAVELADHMIEQWKAFREKWGRA